MRQLIEDLISAMEYHVEQTRPIHSTKVALQAAREALKSLPAQPEQPAEPTCPDCKAALLYECVACSSNNYPTQQQAEPPPEWPLIKNILAEYGLDAIAFVAEFKAAQRPWAGLTEQERNDLEDALGLFIGKPEFDAIEASLKERNT